jgi:hypothetical protein
MYIFFETVSTLRTFSQCIKWVHFRRGSMHSVCDTVENKSKSTKFRS